MGLILTSAFVMMGVFFMVGMYVAGAIGLLSLLLMYFFSDAPLWNILGNKAWETSNNFILIAVPLFILMGEIMLRSGIGDRMYNALARWMNVLPGGLLHTNIASCSIFAACAGSSAATAATISRVALPTFQKKNYDDRMVLGSLAAGGTLGILIPPSIGIILWGVLMEESIGRLYLAGFIPGFMLASLMMLMIAGLALAFPSIAPKEAVSSWKDRFVGLLALIPIFAIIFMVLGTIYMGLATPTEAAAFGVTGALVLALISNSGPSIMFRYLEKANRNGGLPFLPQRTRARMLELGERYPAKAGQLRESMSYNMEMIKAATLAAARTSGMIFLIVIAAFVMSFAFVRLGISQNLSAMVISWDMTTVQLVVTLTVFYLLLGTFMEPTAMLLCTVPILGPILYAAEIDLVWFGIIVIIIGEAAIISPPEGINLYILHGVRQDVNAETAKAEGVEAPESTILDVWIGVLPFMFVMVVMIGLLIVFPEIATWLPDTVMGKRGRG